MDPFAAHDGWTALEGLRASHNGRSFVRRDEDGERLTVRYFRRDADGALVGKILFGPACQGPPGHAHGGSMAAVLDDAMGVSAWIAGHAVVAAEIKIRFRNMLPLGTVAELEASVVEVQGRRIRAEGKLHDGKGLVFASGEGLFIHLGLGAFNDLIEKHGVER